LITLTASVNVVNPEDDRNPFAKFLDTDPLQARKNYQYVRSKLVFFFSHRRLRDPENLADDVIARAWRRFAGGAEITELLHYCYGIAQFVARETVKKPADAQLLPNTEAPDLQAERELAASEHKVLVEECLKPLSVSEAEILVAYFNEDRSALAARLGIPPTTLRVKIYRTVAKVQRALGAGQNPPPPPAETE
jgi:DNA-directed RNA polymerase specialized sigma24 family protein